MIGKAGLVIQKPTRLNYKCFFMLMTSIGKIGIPMSKSKLRDTSGMITCWHCAIEVIVKHTIFIKSTKWYG